MIIEEPALIERLNRANQIFLLEPPYRRKYVPLGLAKISSFAKARGKEVRYGRKYDGWGDLVCVSSVFTYFSKEVSDAIAQAEFFDKPVVVGGIYASLMPKHILGRHPSADVFVGYSQALDLCVPDYSIDWKVEEPFDQYSYVFTTRGCPNTCAYCAVWRIEDVWINPTWRDHIVDEKPWTMVYDNNPGAYPEQVFQMMDYLNQKNKAVEFNNGFDIKHLTPEMATYLGKMKFARRGMRMSFDRIAEDGLFQEKIELLVKHGVSKNRFFVYCLFNFQDTPQEADYRAHECVRLGIEPYPTQYIPLHYTDRKRTYIGKHWTPNLMREFRYFYMMAGYYKKYRFADWIHSDKHKQPLGEEDYAAWESK